MLNHNGNDKIVNSIQGRIQTMWFSKVKLSNL